MFQNNCVFTFYVCSFKTMCSPIQTILNKSHGLHTQKHNTTKQHKLEIFFIYVSLPSCMKFIVQTDQYTQTNTRTHMHAHIRTQAQVPECLCPPLPPFFLKTTLTLLFSPFLHAQRHAWQTQFNRDPTERPNSISLASLCRTGSPKPIKTSVAMHVTVLSMCSVQDKTCVIVPCSGGKKM